MRWTGLFLAGTVALGTGCVGEASALPAEWAVYDFTASVNPLGPVEAGSQVPFNLEVHSRSNQSVVTDVVLKVTAPDGAPVAERHFDQVLFHPEEVWVLLERFMPGASDRGELQCEVIVFDHDSGEELWRSPEKSTLMVP